jgi:cytochrome oxidase Cu insertion factor (SCO1/SenC/PrrC family)/thiol-disulfide isomerase/thioredoxin
VVAAWSIAAALVALVVGEALLAPIRGDVLVLASARQIDHLASSTLQLHSASGWTSIGAFRTTNVPTAPKTVTLLEAMAPVGLYDGLKVADQVLPASINVQQSMPAQILLGLADGGASKASIYVGSQSVSLGLNELSGQMKAVPAFRLFDQFGRPFDNSSITGHDVVLAAFHTTCQQTCPLYTGLFLQLQQQLPTSVLLIEATTDPGHDSADVLRAYAGKVGASWTFLTGDAPAMTSFWKPFDVQLSTADVHRSTLALIDAHGYIRSFYLGAPDVGRSLPSVLADQLNSQGNALLKSRGAGWGQAQVMDALGAIGGLSSPSSTEEGKAPDFVLSTLDGKHASLSEFRGRPVLINYWATFCSPCRAEMPLLQRMADQHPKLVVLLVDERDSTPAARTFITELRIRSVVLLDPDGKAGDLYRIAGLPATIFVREDGTIEGRYLGQTNEQILGSHIAAIGA